MRESAKVQGGAGGSIPASIAKSLLMSSQTLPSGGTSSTSTTMGELTFAVKSATQTTPSSTTSPGLFKRNDTVRKQKTVDVFSENKDNWIIVSKHSII